MNDTIRNQVQVTGTVAGDALTKLPTTDWGNRESIAIHNPDATYKLHVWVVDNGDSAPSLDLDTKFGSVDPGATNIFPFGPGIDVYLANSSGAATTSAYSVFETDMGGVLGLPASAGTPSVTATITGVATEAKQDTQITLLTSIDTHVQEIADTPAYTTGAGATDASTQRVVAATDSPDVTALQIIDDWDESDRAKVNLIAGQAGITGGAGAVAANTPRVVSADDSLDVAGSETIGTGQASVATTETAVVAARNNRHAVMIINHGTTAVYLGPTGLTTSTGVLLAGVVGASITIPTQAAIFGVVASGTQTVSYVELY